MPFIFGRPTNVCVSVPNLLTECVNEREELGGYRKGAQQLFEAGICNRKLTPAVKLSDKPREI